MTTISPTILTTGQLAPPAATAPPRQPAAASADFETVLARAAAGKPQTPPAAAPAAPHSGPGGKIRLGVLNRDQATISDLLSRRPELRTKMWSIIQNPVNSAKPYRQIPRGTPIYLNPATQELSWRGVPETLSRTGRLPPQIPGGPGSAPPLQAPIGSVPPPAPHRGPGVARPSSAEGIFLGRLSTEAPTVSHLLKRHPAGGAHTWTIIHAPQNRAKPFETLAPGTAVYLNPKSGELSWRQPAAAAAAGSPHGLPAPPPSFSPRSVTDRQRLQTAPQMAQAVRSFMGKPYDAMDCYELVINGLEKMGVRYFGRGGLQARLVGKAQRQGLPTNAYLTGEGIIEATGSRLYANTIDAGENREATIRKIIDDLSPLLGSGDILSFSTPSRGHVGVVDRQQDIWTFINSGYLDHQMQAQRPRKGVGEERLSAEIRNWLNLASRRREPLQISLGRLEPRKLRSFYSS